MTYRDEARESLLRERCASLESELADVTARRETERALRSREEELRGELARLRIDLARTDRKLPMLSKLSVASPCSAKWDDMVGDEKTRFCVSCAKDVHNLSAMSALEAEALLQQGQDSSSRVCVRYYQRADGTVMTQDCSVGVRRKRIRRFAALAIGAGAAGAAGATAVSYVSLSRSAPCSTAAQANGSGMITQGEAAMMVPRSDVPEPMVTPLSSPLSTPEPDPHAPTMGHISSSKIHR